MSLILILSYFIYNIPINKILMYICVVYLTKIQKEYNQETSNLLNNHNHYFLKFQVPYSLVNPLMKMPYFKLNT